MDTQERLTAIAEKVQGLEVGCTEAQAAIDAEDWSGWWPTATHDEAGRLVYDGGIIDSQDGYANYDDSAMVPTSECISRDGQYISSK